MALRIPWWSLRRRCRRAPDDVADVVGDEERAARVDRDADGAAEGLALGADEAAQHLDRVARRFSGGEGHEDHVVAATRLAVPGAVLAAIAHRLASSSHSVGAQALGDVFERMESAGRRDDLHEIHGLMREFEQACTDFDGESAQILRKWEGTTSRSCAMD